MLRRRNARAARSGKRKRSVGLETASQVPAAMAPPAERRRRASNLGPTNTSFVHGQNSSGTMTTLSDTKRNAAVSATRRTAAEGSLAPVTTRIGRAQPRPLGLAGLRPFPADCALSTESSRSTVALRGHRSRQQHEHAHGRMREGTCEPAPPPTHIQRCHVLPPGLHRWPEPASPPEVKDTTRPSSVPATPGCATRGLDAPAAAAGNVRRALRVVLS